jgi:hypothetical protein
MTIAGAAMLIEVLPDESQSSTLSRQRVATWQAETLSIDVVLQ